MTHCANAWNWGYRNFDCQALDEEQKDKPFAQKVLNANSAAPMKRVTYLRFDEP